MVKNEELSKLKNKVEEQEQTIEILSNKKIIKGLMSAVEDVKNRNYLVMTNY